MPESSRRAERDAGEVFPGDLAGMAVCTDVNEVDLVNVQGGLAGPDPAKQPLGLIGVSVRVGVAEGEVLDTPVVLAGFRAPHLADDRPDAAVQISNPVVRRQVADRAAGIGV
jgi:hypothetical protein